MRHYALLGFLLAVIGALAVLAGPSLGLEIEHVALLGLALGAVLGLVPDRSHTYRLTGFLAGFAFAWVGYGLRAGFLPDAPSGRAVAVLVVVLLCAGACLATLGRIPLWSTLVGAAAIVGAYEETYTDAPSQFLRESPSAATTVLLAAAIGYLVTTLLPTPGEGPTQEHPRARKHEPPPSYLDEIMRDDDSTARHGSHTAESPEAGAESADFDPDEEQAGDAETTAPDRETVTGSAR